MSNVSAHRMPRALSVALGLAALLGSILGLAFMVPLLLQGGIFGFPGELLLLATFLLYAFGIWSGVHTIRERSGWVKGARWFWLAQVPAYSSPVFSLFISCAAGVWPYVHVGPAGFGAGVSAYIGSGFRWTYGQGSSGIVIGANVLALGIAAYLFRAARNER